MCRMGGTARKEERPTYKKTDRGNKEAVGDIELDIEDDPEFREELLREINDIKGLEEAMNIDIKEIEDIGLKVKEELIQRLGDTVNIKVEEYEDIELEIEDDTEFKEELMKEINDTEGLEEAVRIGIEEPKGKNIQINFN